MRKTLTAVCLTLATVFARPLAAQSTQELFQRALTLERSNGKLDSAITLYRRVVASAGQDRALAARALIRLGSAYEVLGRAEARAAYDRVLREFGDQGDLVTQARARIAALDQRASPSGNATAAGDRVTRKVWEGSGASGSVVPSPDGRSFEFTDWSTGDVAIHDLSTGKDRRLTNSRPPSAGGPREYAEYAAFSPDGKEVAYSWWTGKIYELRIVAVRGGPSRLVLKSEVEAIYAWSSMGDRILGIISRGETSTLTWINPRDGSTQPIHELRSWPVNASVSLDGRWIVFDELSREQPLANYELRIVAADGSGYRPLLEHSAGDWQPLWTPDGRGVAFLSDRSGTRGEWFVEVADGSPHGQPMLLKGDMGANIPIGFSRTGSFFYRTPRAYDVEVATLDPQTGRVIQPPAFVSRSFLGSHANPDWSPDGHTLALILMRGSGTGMPFSRVIELLDVETGLRRELTPELQQLFLPKWSVDGKSLLIWGMPAEKTDMAGFYTVDVATGQVSQVYLGPNVHGISAATWSADARSIYYVVGDTLNDELWRFDRADSSRHRTYSDKSVKRLLGVNASPDGRLLAMKVSAKRESDTGFVLVTRVLSLADGAVRDMEQAPLPQGQATTLQWTPDGALLGLVQRNSDKMTELWHIPLDGGAPRKLEFEAPNLGTIRLTSDGRRIAFEAESPQTGLGLWVIDGLLPKPSRKPDGR
jgi:Tol biopolymer transport system component